MSSGCITQDDILEVRRAVHDYLREHTYMGVLEDILRELSPTHTLPFIDGYLSGELDGIVLED